MDHIKILKRAFKITWDYKALWAFGIILAIAFAVLNSNGNGGNQGQYNINGGDTPFPPEGIPETIELPNGGEIAVPEALQEVNTWITIGAVALGICVVCCCLYLVWIVVWIVLRYVAETALIRMVDDYEETDEKRGIIEGFKMGWSRASLRLFLIDLLLFLAGVAVFVVVFVPLGIVIAALIALAVWMFIQEAIVLGVLIVIVAVAASGLSVPLILVAILAGVAVELFKPFFQRACVLEDLGVGESLARSFDMMKRHFAWDIAVMWLIVVGLNIGWIIAMFFVGLLLFVVAFIVAAIPALIVGGLVSLVFNWIPGLIAGGVVGFLIFIAVLIIVGTFLQGLRMTFLSTVWTLTYRELLALEGLEPKETEPWETEYREEEDSHELQ